MNDFETHPIGTAVMIREMESMLDTYRSWHYNNRQRIDELESKIEDANLTASETQPSWKHRCYRIMDALGQDYGDPDWEMPDDRKRSDMLQADNERLRAAFVRYGTHTDDCRVSYRCGKQVKPCGCGFDEALAAVEDET